MACFLRQQGQPTSVNILHGSNGNRAFVLDLRHLGCKLTTIAKIAAAVHGLLECVALPPKDIVGVLTKSSAALWLDRADQFYITSVGELTGPQLRGKEAVLPRTIRRRR